MQIPVYYDQPALGVIVEFDLMSPFSRYISISAFLAVASCKTAAPPQQIVQEKPSPVIEIGKEQISLEDFQESYNKNKYAEDSTRALSPAEYLGLYTDLKIKVLQAREDGKDTTLDYREEIASYHDQLARNFLVDKALVEKLTNEAYNRLKQEVRASHILIGVSEDASPADTLEAYRAAIALRGRLEEGSDFGDMAARFSKDPAAKTNKGDLGYFTAFQTLYPLETAAYALPVGKLSQPVRTRAGYHLLKVTDKRPNRGTVQIAHIMVQLDTAAATGTKEAARNKIDEAYKRLQEGAAWEEIVEAYSDDRQSKRNKGLLPPFGTGQMVPQIEEAAFGLTRINAFSKPVLTMYGWHIVRLVEKKSLESFTVMAPMLRKKVVTDTRGRLIEQANTQRLQGKYKLQEMPEQWAAVAALADSSIKTGQWDYMRAVTANWSDVTLFSIEDKAYDALTFLDYVKRKQQRKSADASPAVIFRRYYQDYVAECLAAYEREHLEETNPEFRSLMKEIREGVLLSQMMEEHVWQRSLADSVGQKNLYEKNKEKYRFPERAKALLIAARDTQTVNAIRQTLAQPPYRLETRTREILFASGKTETVKEQSDALTDLLIVMQKNPEYVVEVAGYRSPDESEAASAERIRSVVRYLNSRNIPIIRIIEKDYGSFRQSAEPARNRRVSFQFFSPSKTDVEKAYQAAGASEVMIREGSFSKENTLVNRFKWQTGQQNVLENGMAYWIDITAIEPSRMKSFEEARGSVVNDYQKELEKQWVFGLQKKFPVKVNEIELEKVKR